MKYIREYQNGCGGSDPRNKWFAVYECSACGHEERIIIPNRGTFNRRDRRCPECGALDAEDLRNKLQTRWAALEAQRQDIQKEIDNIIKQLDGMPVEEGS